MLFCIQLLLSWTPVWVRDRYVLERWWLTPALSTKQLLWSGLLSHSFLEIILSSSQVPHPLGGVWTAMMLQLCSVLTLTLWPPSQKHFQLHYCNEYSVGWYDLHPDILHHIQTEWDSGAMQRRNCRWNHDHSKQYSQCCRYIHVVVCHYSVNLLLLVSV